MTNPPPLTEVELLPCPNPWRHSCTSIPMPVFSARNQVWHVECSCGIRAWSKPTEAEAITAWNTRSTPDRNTVLASLYKEAWDELRRYIYDRTPERREKIIQRFQEKIAALTTAPEPTDPADPPTCGMCGGDKRIAVTTPADAPNAGWAACPKCSVDPAGLSQMAEVERLIRVAMQDEFLLGRNDPERVAKRYALARSTAKSILALRTPDPVLEVAKEALERLRRNFDLLLHGKPVRDVAETEAEVRAALQTLKERSRPLNQEEKHTD